MDAHLPLDAKRIAKQIEAGRPALYTEKFNDCELKIHSVIDETYSLMLPDGTGIFGVHSPFNSRSFGSYMKRFEGNLISELNDAFAKYFSIESTPPLIFAVSNINTGAFHLTPGDNPGFWKLYYPNGNHIIGYGNVYDSAAFNKDVVKEFEQNIARHAVEWCRKEFAKLYNDQHEAFSNLENQKREL
ncbi:MAG: hypothetical protein WBM13_05750 [Bacteroidia bacterium]